MRRLFRGLVSNKRGRAKFENDKIVFEDENLPVNIDVEDTPYAKFIVNGERKIGSIEVKPGDSIEVVYENNELREPKARLETIMTARENRQLSVRKTSIPGFAFVFEPIKEFQEELRLRVAEIQIHRLDKEPEEIKSFLKEKGVKGDLLEENIEKVAKSKEEIELPVAVGRDPIPGKPDRFELIEGLADEGKVEKNSLIAKYVSETPGTDGYDVYGNVIPSTIAMYFPEMGPGIMVDDTGIRSIKEGRLVFTKHKIDVIEGETIAKNFTWEDGLVEFEGDVIINGDLESGAQIKAGGNILVKGRVSESYLFADGHIDIEGNIDDSVIYSGFSKYAARNVEDYSLQCLVIVERLMFEASFYGEGTSDYSELTKKIDIAKSEYRAIKKSVEPMVSVINQYGDDKVKNLYGYLDDVFEDAEDKAFYGNFGEETMKEAMDLFYDLIKRSKDLLTDRLGTITANSANRSHLYSYFDTKILGSGIFQTNIDSYNRVNIPGKSLVSNITARTSVSLGEFSPGTELDCKIKITETRGSIEAKKIMPDSKIEIADRKYILDNEESDITYTKQNLPR